MDYLKIANSVPMWIGSGLAVAMVLVQAFVFSTRAYKTGKEIGLTNPQLNGAIRSSLISSVGPSIVILTGMLSLLVTVGGPMGWMRLSFIGSVMFEMMAAGFGTAAAGVNMGIDSITDMAFANAVWTMILGSIGWVIFATLTADKMGKVQDKVSSGDKGVITIISTAAMLGAFGSLVSPHLTALNNKSIAALAGGVTMFVISQVSNRKNINWLKEWSLAIALFVGTLTAAFF